MKIWEVELRAKEDPKIVHTKEILEAKNYIEAAEEAIKANKEIKTIVTRVQLITETTIGE